MIVSIDRTKVPTAAAQATKLRPGQRVGVTVQAGGSTKTVHVTLGSLPG